MPNLLPHDWEMTPRYRVLDSEVHRVNLMGRTRWQLHLVKQPSWNYSFLWMRPYQWDDAGFVAFDERFNRECVFGGTETLQTLDRRIYNLIGQGSLARRFVLNTRGELRQGNQRTHEILLATRDGRAIWSNRHTHESTLFEWRRLNTPLTGAQFVALPAAQVWSELQTLLANPNGEAAFARQFARLDTNQRTARIQKPMRGELDELNRLLHPILIASAPWELANDNELFLSFTQRDNARLWIINQSNPTEIDVPAALSKGVHKLWDYFQPFDPTIADYECVQSIDTPSLFARAFRPSAHERLEAQLMVRDWMGRR